MKESDAYAKLRPELVKYFHVDRIENAILPGMPDVILSAMNKTLFVEMKAAIGKRLRGSQVSWCLKRSAKGCNNDMFVIAEDVGHYLIFFMADVAKNAGIVELETYHQAFSTPSQVARFFDMYVLTVGGRNVD
jgi:hypothetical protein